MHSGCKYFGLLFLLWATAVFAVDARDSLARDAAVLLDQQKFEQGLNLLRKIPADSKFHTWAITEAAKIHYRRQQWSSFFGLAAHARQHFLVTSALDEVRLLEILALLRHCQNEAAIEQVRLGLKQSTPEARARFEMLASLLEVAATAPDEAKVSQAEERVAGESIFRGKHLWPVPAKAAQNLDPWKLQRKIDARCEVGEAP